MREDAPSGTPPECVGRVGDDHRWFRCAQPPAGLWEPSGFGKEARRTRTPTAERPGNLVLVPRPPAGNGMCAETQGRGGISRRLCASARDRFFFRPEGRANVGQRNVGQGNGGQENQERCRAAGTGSFHSLALHSFAPPRAPGRRLSKLDLSRLAAPLGGSASLRETVSSSVHRGKRMWGRGMGTRESGTVEGSRHRFFSFPCPTFLCPFSAHLAVGSRNRPVPFICPKQARPILKANGKIDHRVQQVGPERFGIVTVDCAKPRFSRPFFASLSCPWASDLLAMLLTKPVPLTPPGVRGTMVAIPVVSVTVPT